MPWYGMHLIDRVRNQARATTRDEERIDHGDRRVDEPSRRETLRAALPTVSAVALWVMAAAMLHGMLGNYSRTYTVFLILAGPLLMAFGGWVWGSEKASFRSGVDAALVTGVLTALVLHVTVGL